MSWCVVGSRFVYSTCSLNPLEDEAVVCSVLRKHSDTLRLVNIRESISVLDTDETNYGINQSKASSVYGKLRQLGKLKWHNGMNYWRTDVDVMAGDDTPGGEEIHNSDEDISPQANVGDKRKHMEAKQKSIAKLPPLLSSMLPPSIEEQENFHLDRCVRIFPHDQDTGGFFIAVFERYDGSTGHHVEAKASTAGAQIPTAVTPEGITHQEEVSILKNICGYNPKQISISGEDLSEENSDLIKKWEAACRVYKYCSIPPALLSGVMSISQDIGAAHNTPSVAAITTQNFQKHILCCTHPYDHSLEQGSVEETSPTAAQVPIVETNTDNSAPWKHLNLLSKFQSSAQGNNIINAEEVTTPVNSTRNVIGYLCFASENVQSSLLSWSGEDNYNTKVVVQAGVDIATCFSSTKDSTVDKLSYDFRNHNVAGYLAEYFPALVRYGFL